MKHEYVVPLSLVLLLLFLLGTGWGFNILLKQGADSLTAIAETLQTQIYQQQWSQTEITFAEIKKTWHSMNKYWPMLIHHQEMDRIEESLCKLEIYLQYQEPKDALSELTTLIKVIQHIPQKEILNLRNLF